MFVAYLGLMAGLGLLIWLALRGVNIIFASVLCSLVVIVTNGLPLAEGLGEYYSFGNLGAFTFAGRFFLLFVAGMWYLERERLRATARGERFHPGPLDRIPERGSDTVDQPHWRCFPRPGGKCWAPSATARRTPSCR